MVQRVETFWKIFKKEFGLKLLKEEVLPFLKQHNNSFYPFRRKVFFETG